MAITKSIDYSGTAENNDIKSILIKRVLVSDGADPPVYTPELHGFVEVQINANEVRTFSAPLTAGMKSDVVSWLPTILAFITSELGL